MQLLPSCMQHTIERINRQSALNHACRLLRLRHHIVILKHLPSDSKAASELF